MQFLVMGPIQAWNHDREVELRGSKITTVLAALLLSRGRVVSDGTLSDWLWGGSPPATAQAQIQTYASRLRHLLGPTVRIDRQRPGYRISSKEHHLDLLEFERLAAVGRADMAAHRPEEASAHFAAALALWRGPALAGVSEFLTAMEGPGLEESRLVVLESRIDADLELGRHGELIAELLALVAEHPHRERPRTQLMRALHQCGRRVEALAVYHDYRRLLVDDLGLEPSARLQEMHHLVLTEDSLLPQSSRVDARGPLPEASRDTASPRARALVVRPAELPPAPVDFTGRAAEIEDICGWMSAQGGREGAPPVCAILGMPGMGKTALALFAAHQLRHRYPDGQLYINVAPGGRATDPTQALRDLLQALGVDPAVMPDTVEDLTRIYRSCVSGRRLLVVVDNVVGEEQIRPLLPGTAGCGMLVTTRGRLAAVEGIHAVPLTELGADEARELLARIIGPRRMAAEPTAASRIVDLCAGHPLALRISGAKLASRPHWSLARLAERLADEDTLLNELSLGDLQVRAGLLENHRPHRREVRRALLALSRLGTTPFSLSTAARVIGTPVDDAQNLIDELVDAHLLGMDGDCPGCYRLHRMTWALARELVAAGEAGFTDLSAVPVRARLPMQRNGREGSDFGLSHGFLRWGGENSMPVQGADAPAGDRSSSLHRAR